MTHGHLTLDPDDPEDLGSAAMDIFRFDNTGRIVEHWTDSVPAEVKRLESAGARRKRKVKSWWVLEDPAGMAFCVVRPQQPAELSKRRPWAGPADDSPT